MRPGCPKKEFIYSPCIYFAWVNLQCVTKGFCISAGDCPHPCLSSCPSPSPKAYNYLIKIISGYSKLISAENSLFQSAQREAGLHEGCNVMELNFWGRKIDWFLMTQNVPSEMSCVIVFKYRWLTLTLCCLFVCFNFL